MSIKCRICGQDTPKKSAPGQDDSHFVCKKCVEVRNQPGYKKEITELEAELEPTVSQTRRLEYLKNKLL